MWRGEGADEVRILTFPPENKKSIENLPVIPLKNEPVKFVLYTSTVLQRLAVNGPWCTF